MAVGRETQVVACRKGQGLGLGGGIAQRGTFAKAWKNDVIAVAMSPGIRHVPKPVCEITTELRHKGINTGEIILNAGDGTPLDAPRLGGHGVAFGLEQKEIDIIGQHKLVILHHGNVKSHFIYKVRFELRKVPIRAIVLCQSPVEYEDFEAIGVSTRNKEGETPGKLVGIVSGIVRHESVPQDKLDEIVSKVKMCLREIEESEEPKKSLN
jgi:methyl-coenzyme M reductase subunit C